MRRLSRFRDVQVQQGMLGPMVSGHPSLAVFLEHLKSMESSAGSWLARELASFPEAEVSGAVTAVLAALLKVGAGSAAEVRARRRLSGRFRRSHLRLLALRSGIDPADPGTIHRLRVAFKKYRYLAEPLAGMSGNQDPEALPRMHQLQGAMGDIQDLAVLLRDLRSWAARSENRRELDPLTRLLALRLGENISSFISAASEMDSFVFPFGHAK